jgi:flagellar biosynthesis/type III secretory pathway ATPase
VLDKAISALPEINKFLRQAPDEIAPLDQTVEQLLTLPG